VTPLFISIFWIWCLASDSDELGAGTALAIAPDGLGVIAPIMTGQLTRIVRFPRDGRASPATLFTLTNRVWALDVGPDGTIYADQTEQPLVAAELATTGGPADTLGSVDGQPCCATAAVLLATGKMTLIPTDYFCDFHFLLWAPGEKSLIGGGYPTRYSLWRFRPVR
jgi:hypothetical protein